MRANVKKRTFAKSTLKRAIGVPFLFGVLFAAAYPPMGRQAADDHPSLTPAAIVLVFAICGWFFVLWSILRGIRAGVAVRSGWAAVSVLPLVAYGFGLVMALMALQGR